MKKEEALFVAEGIFFVCTHCGKEIEAWSDGDPYYLDEDGVKCYAHHPSTERERCIGVDSPHLCLTCGALFKVDSRKPRTDCSRCNSNEIVDTFNLDGRQCPYCGHGHFMRDPDRRDIS